jgi:hypothetical protein
MPQTPIGKSNRKPNGCSMATSPHNKGVSSAAQADASALLSDQREAFQTVQVDGATVILSVRPNETLGGASGIGSDWSNQRAFYLYAEQLTLAGPVKLARTASSPHGTDAAPATANILATHILSIADGATLDVSGQDGPAASGVNEGGMPALPSDGGVGAMLSLYAECLDPPTASPVVNAMGGAGSPGQPGAAGQAGGNGGDGAAGGQVNLVLVHVFAQILRALAGLSSIADPAAQLASARQLGQQFSAIAQLDTFRSAVSGTPLPAAVAAAIRAAQLAVLVAQEEWEVALDVNVAAGAYGAGGAGAPPGRYGVTRAAGSMQDVLVAAAAELPDQATLTPFMWIHPAQSAMLLETAVLSYLVLDPGAATYKADLDDLYTRLTRLRDRTDPFVGLVASHPVALAFSASEGAVGAIGSVASLQQINAQVRRYLDQLYQGVDVFGNAPNYTPAISFGLLQQQAVTQALAAFKSIEDAYEAYNSALAASSAQLGQFTAAREQCSAVLQTLVAEIADLNDKAVETAQNIDQLQLDFPVKRAALDQAVARAITEIQAAIGVNARDFMAALGTIGMAPESALNVSAQVGLFMSSMNDDIKTDQGGNINKNYLVTQLRAADADVDALAEGYRALSDGTLDLDDPGAAKLLADESKLMGLLDQVSSQVSAITDVQQAFDAFVAVALQRNAQVLQYNALVTSLVRHIGERGDMQARYDALNLDVIGAMAADAPDVAAFTSKLYYRSRRTVLALLATAAQAYRFWGLSDLGLAQWLGSPPQMNQTVLDGARLQMIASYTKAVEDFGGAAEPFPANAAELGMLVPLNRRQLALLTEPNSAGDYEVIVHLSEVYRMTPKQNNPFFGKANVRLTKVRLWLGQGARATSSDATVTIEITHNGRETIVSPANQAYAFSHPSRKETFAYTLDTTSITQDTSFGVAPEDGSSGVASYALYGPFAFWTLSIPQRYNDIDLSEMVSATLEFHGTAYSFQ